LLPFLSYLSAILPIVFFVFFFKRNKQGGFWVILLYCIISFLTDSTYSHLQSASERFYVFVSFTIVEYTLFSLFLYLSLKEKTFRTVLLVSSLLFYAVALFNFTSKKEESFDSLSASVEGILVIIYSIFFLYEQIKDPTIFFIYQSKKFWIILALLIYCSSTLFLFIYAATFPQQSSYWNINNIFDIIKNILFCVSFVMKKTQRSQIPLEDLYRDL
jgi:hypothetical protein